MYSCCRVCGRPLKSKSSIAKGVGPGCEKKLLAANRKDTVDHAAEIENFIDEIKEENTVKNCDRCGKAIRFIKREGDKALVVNATPGYYVPHPFGDRFVTVNGEIRRGAKVHDGILGYTLHKC